MQPSRFYLWLAKTLGQPPDEVAVLLSHEMAVEFLMSWSLFESRCFGGYMKLADLDEFAKRTVQGEAFEATVLGGHFQHFHDRYQDSSKRRSLFHQQRCERFAEITRAPASNATPDDVVFYCTAVAYRFRNNMFHGSKGVRSWLQFKEQIERCSGVVQSLISHAESRSPRLAML